VLAPVLQVRQRRRHGQRVPAVGRVEAYPRLPGGVGDRFGHQRRPHRRVTGGDRLGQTQHVRIQLEMFGGEEFAGASKPGRHLVHDEQRAALAARIAHADHELVRGDQHAEVAHHRLHDERGDLLVLQQPLHAIRGPVVQRRFDLPAVRDQVRIRLAITGEAAPPDGVAMVAASQGDEARATRSGHRHLQRDLDGFGAAGGAVTFRQLAGRDLGQAFCQLRPAAVQVVRMDVGGAVKVSDGSADFLVPPAEIADAPAGCEIKVFLAVLIEEEAALRAGNVHALGRLLTSQIQPVALRHVHNRLRGLAVGLSR
jgi:hypothetical protein